MLDAPVRHADAAGDLKGLRVLLGFGVTGHSWGADLAPACALMHPERPRTLVHLSGTGIQNDRDWKAACRGCWTAGRCTWPCRCART